jgi:hypothetical protein
MKKLFAILIASALLLGLAACGNTENTTEDETTQASAQQLYLVMDIGWGDGPEEYPFEGEATVEGMAAGLGEMTGLVFDVTAQGEDGFITVDWAAGSNLFDGDSAQPKEELGLTDYDGMVWLMLDSLALTIAKNINLQELTYTMDGGKTLVLEKLSPPVSFDGPYMLKDYYLDGRGDIIDEEPVDPADVAWAGEFGSEAGMLYITDYDEKTFKFKFDNDGVIFEGTAALDPETGILASYETYVFRFNLEQGTITVWVGDGNAVDYVNTADAVG